jgi:hypothetical protein
MEAAIEYRKCKRFDHNSTILPEDERKVTGIKNVKIDIF